MNTKKTANQKPKQNPKLASKNGPAAQSARQEEPAADTAQVLDFVGAAMLILPKELEELLGTDLLQSNAAEAELDEVLLIVREPGVVAYVHLPIVAMQMDGTAFDLADGKVSLRAVNGPWDKRVKRKAKAHGLVTLVHTDPSGGQDA